jgi:restriction system protein
MPVPTYGQFIEPILRYLATKPDGASARDVHDAAAAVLHLSDSDRAELLPSGTRTVYKNRAGWAQDRLKRSGLSASLRRGFWKLTDAGREFAAANPAPLPDEVIERLAADKTDVRLRTAGAPLLTSTTSSIEEPRTASPDDRLEAALAELRETVVTELLESLSQVTPQHFETIVLDLLHRMGYGTSRADL